MIRSVRAALAAGFLSLAAFVLPAPVAYTQPVSQWNYDVDPATGSGRATYPGEVKVGGLAAGNGQCVKITDATGSLGYTTCAGAGITQLTGDVTAGPGSGSQAATLAASGVTAGSYTTANITVDAKGRVTSAANGSVTSLSGHTTFSGSAPTIGGSCGTSPSVSSGSTDGAGTFTIGSGTPSSCVLTFATAYTTNVSCVANELGHPADFTNIVISLTTITFAVAGGAASDKVTWHCFGT